MDYLPLINYTIIVLLFVGTVVNLIRIHKLEDRIRRLDGIVALHLEMDLRYTKEKIAVDP